MSTTPYPAGQAVRLPAKFTDSTTGLGVDPETLTLTITLPDGSTETHAIGALTHLAAGSYEYVYTPPGSGHYGYEYKSTAPNGGLPGQFDALPDSVFTDAGQTFGWPTSYMTVAEFRAFPTGVDVNDLINNGSRAANDAELANQLLRASQWADGYCTIRLGAHQVLSEHDSLRVDSDGLLWLHPRQTSGLVPPIACTRLAYGSVGGPVTTITPTSTWVEDGAMAIPASGGGSSSWSGPIQFGTPTGSRVAVEYDYTAGFPQTVLTADAALAATSLAVYERAGIQPGQMLRIHDPGTEETVTVSPTWTPATGAGTVAVSATLAAHDTGTGVGSMPEDIRTAVAQMTVVLIRRSSDTGSPSVDKSVGTDMAVFSQSARTILDQYKRKAY
ncbi:hypothetical protein [Frankia sp. AgW1.1]|uniref:hypothetical protein n=1 Tax=Frankia sp. AgW1.1 TaxID=1836971 RepID=UPI0019336C8F|nr:hypothetical protein [Frankia sp. AgW1.1]MBL7487083.1 hypothetical protein [Frankia sp. AgW1.1]